MNSYTRQTLLSCAFVAGLALWVSLAMKFDGADRLEFEPNVACLNGSPYGKVLVLVMQEEIEVYTHKGQSHENAILLKNPSEQPGGAAVAEDEVHVHGENCGCPDHAAAAVSVEPAQRVRQKKEVPMHKRAKHYVKTLSAYSRRRTDDAELTPAHRQYIEGVIEDKLKFAYSLDPSNQSNYESYYFYLSVSSLGKSKADQEAALDLARQTMAYCRIEDHDPSTALTGAGAAYDIAYYISRHPEKFTAEEAHQVLDEGDEFLKRYEILLDESPQKGFVVTAEQLIQMNDYARQLMARHQAQKTYLKRQMSSHKSVTTGDRVEDKSSHKPLNQPIENQELNTAERQDD